MEGVVTIFGDIVAKFSTFSEEHSFILAVLLIVVIVLIVFATQKKNHITIDGDNHGNITIGKNNHIGKK